MHQTINRLLKDLEIINERYYKAKYSQRDYDFYNDVVPFTSQIDNHIEEMQQYHDEIVSLTYMNQLKYMKMIEILKELSVECHYQRTSKKIFTEKYKALHADLSYIEKTIKGD